jgi:hypothetical protein
MDRMDDAEALFGEKIGCLFRLVYDERNLQIAANYLWAVGKWEVTQDLMTKYGYGEGENCEACPRKDFPAYLVEARRSLGISLTRIRLMAGTGEIVIDPLG